MKTVFSNCNIIDVENDCNILKNMDIVIDGGKITEISEHKSQRDGKIIDLKGKFAMPGLINLHVHLFGTGMPSKILSGGNAQKKVLDFIHTKLGAKVLAMLVENSAKQQLYSGVTTIRTVGDFCYSDILLKDKVLRGKSKANGLRMIVSGPAITVPGGHGGGTFALTAEKPEDFVRIVEENVKRGADLIKICITGGVMDAKKKGEPGILKMNAQQVKAVCDKAHELGKKVAAHIQSQAGVELAIQNGVDTVEHGGHLSQESIAMLKENNGAFIVTYSPAIPNVLLPASVTKLNDMCAYNSKIVMDGMTEGALQCLNNGIDVGLGTDSSCPFCTQYNTWRELVYMNKVAKISTKQAIYTATMSNAKILGLQDQTGSIKAGKSADIIVLDSNPLEDLKALKDIAIMSSQGVIIKKPSPKRNKKLDLQLDKILEEI